LKNIIAIEARIPNPEIAGGVAQVIMSLAVGLSKLSDGNEDYVFVGLASAREWLAPLLAGPCRLHVVPPGWKQRLANSAWGPKLIEIRRAYRSMRKSARSKNPLSIAVSDGQIEALGAELVHFPAQGGYLTGRPSIYHPHDLQHLHLPEFFDPETLEWRNRNYPVFCSRAAYVVVESSWTKNDVVTRLGVPAEKVAVIPVPPPPLGAADESISAKVAALVGFSRFIFYPAQTWPHKNHLRLIDALALLKQRFGLTVPLVGSGRQSEHFGAILARVEEQALTEQVRFLGYVDPGQLAALYRLSTMVVVPTKFESLSLPIWEAFSAGRAAPAV